MAGSHAGPAIFFPITDQHILSILHLGLDWT